MRLPNLIFIFTDEQRFDTIAAYGNTQIEMPNLNRFASECIVFENAYCTSPVCTPSRSSLLTGLYSHQNGCTENNFPLSQSTMCLPELISSSPYATGYIGKWHLGDEVFAQHGFQEWISVEDLYIDFYSPERDRNTRSSYHHHLLSLGYQPDAGSVFSRDYCSRLPEEHGKPAFLANQAIEFIKKHKSDPFILYVNFLEPHMPYFGPRDNQFSPNLIPLPQNFNNLPTENQHLKYHLIAQGYYDRGHSGLPLKTDQNWKKMIANYWGLCSLVDTHLGRILTTINSEGIDDNTIIVFTSDHGDMMGSHHLLAKCVMFEEATRIPLLIKIPGMKKSSRISRPISQIDLVPTLLDLMGQPIPVGLAGESLKSEILTGNPAQVNPVFIEWNGRETGILEHYEKHPLPVELEKLADREKLTKVTQDPIRTIVSPDRWKYSHSQLGMHELYNLNNDPFETTNLYHLRENRQRISNLRAALDEWQRKTNDILSPINE